MSTIEQSRYLATAIPGPKSSALIERKTGAVARGVGNTMQVYAARAGGGIVEDVDGNRFIDLGSGIAVTTIGNASPPCRRGGRRPGRGVHPHLFHGYALRGLRRGVRALEPVDPGEG